MSIKVYQNKNFLFFQMGINSGFPSESDLIPVAIVETNSLEQAYDLTQSPHPTRVDSKVKILNSSIRSTSIGDVLEDSWGNRFIVTSNDFQKLN
ncbi:MAG: hypothetical protein WBB28_13510 [Crinalium sp.]